MARIPALLCLDIEDPITLRSHQAAGWITRAISDAGLTASCFLVAEKVRAWDNLGLRDVIEAVKRHDLGFHTSRHSYHPTISEISESLPAQSGAEMLWGWERVGWEDAERIMGKPINNWGISGGSWSPALAVMLARRGHATMYSPISGEDRARPCWFAGGLHIADFFGGLDATYHNDAQFAEALGRQQGDVDARIADGAPYLGIFCCHPTRVVHHTFWDIVNFTKGGITVPEDWASAPAITAEEEETAQANMCRYLDWVASDRRFEVMGISRIADLFRSQKVGCAAADVYSMAQRIADEGRVIFTDAFTAAEILSLMVEYVREENAKVIMRQDVLSPTGLPVAASIASAPVEAIVGAAWDVSAFIRAHGRLPETVDVIDGSMYIADYFVALARSIVAIETGGADAVAIAPIDPYPAIGDDLAAKVEERIRGWSTHREDIDLSWIKRDTRLLSWTFKPAWTVDELALK